MKISIYGDRFMKSEIFEEVIKNKLSDHVISFTKKDVEWPDGPFHNDYGKGHFSNIKEYFGNEDDVINTVKDNEILITDLAPITENIINKIPNLKFIGVSRGGPVNIDIEACKKNDITVVNAPGRNASAVAEFTIASILS